MSELCLPLLAVELRSCPLSQLVFPNEVERGDSVVAEAFK